MPVASKAVINYVVYRGKSVIDELGYSDVRIAPESDALPELQHTWEQVRNLWTAPATAIDVPVQESKINGAVERAIKSWDGQLNTIRDHVEGGLGEL